MYLPSYVKNESLSDIHAVIQRYPFATVIASDDTHQVINPLPLILDLSYAPFGKLYGHLARANPQTEIFLHSAQVTCLFHGPQQYISPRWYRDPLNVPTWNYILVQIQGRIRRIETPSEIKKILELSATRFDPQWQYDLPKDFEDLLLKHIVGIEITIESWEGKFKLSQNRSKKNSQGVIENLSAQTDPQSQEMLYWMKRIGEKSHEFPAEQR